MYKRQVKDTIDAVTHSGSLVAQAGRTVIATMNPLALPHHLESALDLVRHPTKLIDVLTGFTSDDNETSNSWREVGRLLLHEKADAGAVSYTHLDVYKRQEEAGVMIEPRHQGWPPHQANGT